MTNTNGMIKSTEQKADFADGDEILGERFKYLEKTRNTERGKKQWVKSGSKRNIKHLQAA